MASAQRSRDPQIELHKQWLGYLQPQGLVVSPIALVEAQAYLNTSVLADQGRLRALFTEVPVTETERQQVVPSIRNLCVEVLGWRAEDLVPGADTGIEAPLPEYQETLRPDYAVKEAEAPHPWLLLIRVLPHGTSFDADAALEDDRNWQASWHARFERLLKESQVPIGLLFNGTHVRLVYAPKGEPSGHLTFPFQSMAEVAGRPILAGLILLLGQDRLFTQDRNHGLRALLEKSRKYQNQVSTRLAEQVLEALHEMLRGFQRAHADSKEQLLAAWLRQRPDDIYGGLLTVLLRLIFLLYAEDRGLLSGDRVYQDGYALQTLFEQLRQDADRFQDTMKDRFGAWAQLLALFRLVFDGGSHGTFRLPTRHGYLFHPDGGEGTCYQFLEGRPLGEARQVHAAIEPPRVSDGVVWHVLERLMLLDGERISYRTLNVEQIGSVYETMMGFKLQVTSGPSLAIKPDKPHGAPAVVNLFELLEEKPDQRAKWLAEHADCKVTDKAKDALKQCKKPEDVPLALGSKVSALTPTLLPAGSLVLQPTDARRKSGSHYTPPQLTQPIVTTTLRPILERLGENPRPEQLLDLKVCDPAMGSGAFLVEACRQLGAHLVTAWHAHRCLPKLPPDEDELLYAKRLVVQRCLCGVDRNPFAVALAKLSLWLETFAKDHPFTFLDHVLRCGDSLVGLSQKQIAAFDWEAKPGGEFVRRFLDERLRDVGKLRQQIREAGEGTSEDQLRRLLRDADEALDDVRLAGDLVVAAFFGADKPKEREALRRELGAKLSAWLQSRERGTAAWLALRGQAGRLRDGDEGVRPFHWEVEFPEVVARGGFDAFVGNPPFLGGKRVSETLGDTYSLWLESTFHGGSKNADLCCRFFVLAFDLLQPGGALGLLATKTIAQGDTRSAGLRWVCLHGGDIYCARKRIKWPGIAAVVVSVVHIQKGAFRGQRMLDDKAVPRITAYLFHDGGHEDPLPLRSNEGKSFIGSYVLGMGFTFDDTSEEATPLAEMERLIHQDPRNRERIFPYLGGEEINDNPMHAHHRYVINFGEMTEEEARKGWPELMAILEARVRPERATKDANKYPRMVNEWWKHFNNRRDLAAAIRGMDRVLVIARVGEHGGFTFLRNGMVFSEQLVVCALPTHAAFATLQSRAHEGWARFFGSSLEDRFRYTPSDCFESFPFPPGFEHDPRLEAAGKAYYDFRAALMVRNNEGLTKTYNRFHDRDDTSPDILKLRDLHAAVDRAVLDAYGWTDLKPTHDFLLDYEEEEDDDEPTTRKKPKKKPWRCRWPDRFRDEVLARLLRLNQERADEERLHAPPPKPKPPSGPGKKKSPGKGLYGED